MKAKIRKTGEILDVTRNKHGFYVDENRVGYTLNELDFGNEENEHWQDVRERAAIAALGGMLADTNMNAEVNLVAQIAVNYADVLVERLK